MCEHGFTILEDANNTHAGRRLREGGGGGELLIIHSTPVLKLMVPPSVLGGNTTHSSCVLAGKISSHAIQSLGATHNYNYSINMFWGWTCFGDLSWKGLSEVSVITVRDVKRKQAFIYHVRHTIHNLADVCNCAPKSRTGQFWWVGGVLCLFKKPIGLFKNPPTPPPSPHHPLPPLDP
jgi:hypothetical protein